MKRALLIAALLLSGCQEVNDGADSAAEYIPFVGDRCDRLQCLGADADIYREDYVPNSSGKKPDAPAAQQPASAPPPEQRKRFPGPR